MKKGIAIVTLTTILMMLSINVLAVCPCTQNTVAVYVDGEKLSFPDQAPFINPDNRTLVPVRFVSEALGADVEWNGEQQRVDISHQGKGIKLTIGQKEAQVDTGIVTLDTNAAITNSRTMVPLRFVSECLGAQVRWEAAERAVYITTSERAKDEALVNSDLILDTPSPGNNENNVNLIATIDYRFNRPVEPQITDLQEILERRFTPDQVKPIIDYIGTKKVGDGSHLPVKDWTINGKLVRVGDAILLVTVQIWN